MCVCACVGTCVCVCVCVCVCKLPLQFTKDDENNNRYLIIDLLCLIWFGELPYVFFVGYC